ncbi:MAG: hypothetical protein MUC38_11070 [Cyclobacteriaceae bacterium]|jgi:hypothetical protein|nr:hypothetical protein [Cyclobacteriaceae bacterium]
MNNKYFGNALDLFKFDLLTHLALSDQKEIFYVGMITQPQPKELDPKYLTYELGSRNEKLREFLQEKFTNPKAEVSDITEYFTRVNVKLHNFSNGTWFEQETRDDYFQQVIHGVKLLTRPSIVYLDPDVGSDIAITRRYRSNKELYAKKEEIANIRTHLKPTDFLGYFQHLGNAAYTVAQRVEDIKKTFGEWALVVGYQRVQVASVFLFNDMEQYIDKQKKIQRYLATYDDLPHRHKIILE